MRLFALIIALFVAGPAAAANWKEYTYPDYAMTVHFPSDPTIEETKPEFLGAVDPTAEDASVSVEDYKLSANDLVRITISDLEGPDTRDICYATQNRQSSVRDLSKLVDVILVVGAANSSNSNRLREIGTEAGVASYLIADGSELNRDWLKHAKAVGITAGASAPEVLVDDVIEALRRTGPVSVSVLPGREENIEFRLPAALAAG